MKELIVSPVYNAKGNIVGQEFHGELIRCKDCKWNTADEWVHCAMLGGMFGRTTDNYCSLAERKDNGKDTNGNNQLR